MTRDADVAIVGAGVAGLATAHALRRRGRHVVVLEQFDVGHERGSSHGSSRIFRLAYPDPAWVHFALEAERGWRRLEASSGERLIVRTGALDVGDRAVAVASALGACGVEHELLDGRQAARRWPLHFEASEAVVFHAAGGISLADRAVAVFRVGAAAEGAEVRVGVRVDAVAEGADGVALDTSAGELRVGACVIAAGAWVVGLVEPLGVALDVEATRETVAYFALPAGEELPSLIDYASTGAAGNGVPRPGVAGYALAAPGIGLKAGLHHSGPASDPDEASDPEPALVAWTTAWAGRRYGEAAGEAVLAETCLYTSTSDERFLLERHGRVVVGSACSGHGFKFAPVVGERLATLAEEALAA